MFTWLLKLTCIGLQVLGCHHYNKADCPFIAKHLVGPAADGAHAFDRCNTIVGNKHLEEQNSWVTACPIMSKILLHLQYMLDYFALWWSFYGHSGYWDSFLNTAWFVQKKEVPSKNLHLLDNFVATKAGDKLSRGSHGEVPLEIDTPAISALFHQVQPRHARPVLRNRKTPLVIKRMRSLEASWEKQKTQRFSFSTVSFSSSLKDGMCLQLRR